MLGIIPTNSPGNSSWSQRRTVEIVEVPMSVASFAGRIWWRAIFPEGSSSLESKERALETA